jgi:hypothetical protein
MAGFTKAKWVLHRVQSSDSTAWPRAISNEDRLKDTG